MLLEGWIEIGGICKLFIGSLFVLKLFELEECIAESKFSGVGKLFYPRFEHQVHLLEHLLAAVLHVLLPLALFVLHLQGTVRLRAHLLVLLYVTNQQHVAILVHALATHQLQHLRQMQLELLSALELKVAHEESIDVGRTLKVDYDDEEGETTHPYHQGPIKAIIPQN